MNPNRLKNNVYRKVQKITYAFWKTNQDFPGKNRKQTSQLLFKNVMHQVFEFLMDEPNPTGGNLKNYKETMQMKTSLIFQTLVTI